LQARLTDLVVQSDIWYCNEIADVFDVFEPMYLISAFSLTEAKRFHLAHLVFGPDLWISLSSQDLELPEDPLTMMYRRLCYERTLSLCARHILYLHVFDTLTSFT